MSVPQNLMKTQNLFSDLSLKTNSSSATSTTSSSQQSPKPFKLSSSSPALSTTSASVCSTNKSPFSSQRQQQQRSYSTSAAYYKDSPEIHDLIRFQNAIMLRYSHTQDEHFKNMAKALGPQIEDKIRQYKNNNGRI